MSPRRLWRTVKSAAIAWKNDSAPSMGAALAYYTVFSIVPLLILIIAVAGLFFGADAVREEIVRELGRLMDETGAEMIDALLESANRPERGITAGVVSIFTLLLGATTVLAELQRALDVIWKAPASKRPKGVWGLLRARFLSLGMILALGFLLVVSLALSTALAALGEWWGGAREDWMRLLEVLNFVFTFAVITAVIAAIYKFMPSVKIHWRDVWVGAAVTALLLAIGKYLIGLYIGRTGIASGFGAAGSLIVILVWVYYSTQIFLLGAEFTWVQAQQPQQACAAPSD